MKAGHIKGALLEYIVRNILKNCGFTNVKADNLFSFEQRGLFLVNGKGAAHDADIIMNPPIQMPFTYPTQLIFECKAYKVDLSIVRNALGLRNDLNDFEVVTRESLKKRKDNRRTDCAVDARARFLYQVGVASIDEFSKPAVEFAINNKIPLLSLKWFLGANISKYFDSIDQPLIDRCDSDDIQNLYDFLKDREGNLSDTKYEKAYNLLQKDTILKEIITLANDLKSRAYVGLLETGDMVFLVISSGDNILQQNGFASLKAEIHYDNDRPDVWRLSVYNQNNPEQKTDFDFFIPLRIFEHWEKFNLDKSAALGIKQEFFSRIFVFNQQNNSETFPFSLINIDKEWLQQAICKNRETQGGLKN